jgi:PGF-CTERM protein
MNEDGPRLLASLVEQVNGDSSIDFVITTGDLTNGAEADYSGFTSTMDDLNVPWYPILGNWDKNEEGWEDYYLNHMGRSDTYYSMDRGGYHIVVMDSAIHGEVGGDLDETQMIWLKGDLDANADKPTLIFLHHMADRTDDIFGITPQAQERLNGILSTRPQVLSLHSGHIHQNILSSTGEKTNLAYASVVQYPIGYSVIRLYQGGYSQSFLKVDSELATSEESRVRINANSGSTNADEEYLGDLGERSIVIHVPGNNPPVISSISVEHDRLKPREETTISVVASDPDGDDLTYHYDPVGGTISGEGSSVIWQAPESSGDYSISIWVSDGEKNSDRDVVSLTIEEDKDDGKEASTPGFEVSGAVLALLLALALITVRRDKYG